MKNHRALLLLPMMALLSACDSDDPDTSADEFEQTASICGPRTVFSPDDDENLVEFIDNINNRAWGTWDISRDQAQEVELPQGWSKQIVLNASFDKSTFYRSASCDELYQFNEQDMYGGRFFNMVDIIDMPEVLEGTQSLLRKGKIKKYQGIEFALDSEIRILVNSQGQRWIEVAHHPAKRSQQPVLPAGWEIKSFTITTHLTIELFGELDNMVTSDNALYQGPLPQDLSLADFARYHEPDTLVKDTLRLVYGKQVKFNVQSAKNTGTEIVIQLPNRY